jgi:hypothetical protein
MPRKPPMTVRVVPVGEMMPEALPAWARDDAELVVDLYESVAEYVARSRFRSDDDAPRQPGGKGRGVRARGSPNRGP